ncbi:MAG TPA: ABC transporter ATP-binding protein [Hyphomicrobiaceae bacterium]|jgi:iron(III) transport system ATP-binding protein|nr:ABC transporter ATP-binding protein [Hyphomicrobiaceae bacterium]
MAGITIRGLTKRYAGEAAAVRDLALDVADGSFVTLLGPSGCGKTTTLRLIAGFLRPDAGTIEAGGKLVSSPEHVVPPEARGMGMVFQNYAVWPHKTVYENVVFGLKLRRIPAPEARAKVRDALALVNLAGLEDRLPGELSGGQQQRVALARSLVVEPGILLLDEPLSNLDAKLRERMRGELKDLQRRTGITFVYVTHDQAEALALSDKIAVIQSGRLVQLGTPREVYERPASRDVADFMGLVNLVRATVAAADGPRLTLRTAAGWIIEAEGKAPGRPGTEVEVAIRPENVHLGAPEAPEASGPNRARIADSTFLGSLMEYQVALQDGSLLRAQAHPSLQFAVGDEVTVRLDTAARATVFDAVAEKDASGRREP